MAKVPALGRARHGYAPPAQATDRGTLGFITPKPMPSTSVPSIFQPEEADLDAVNYRAVQGTTSWQTTLD